MRSRNLAARTLTARTLTVGLAVALSAGLAAAPPAAAAHRATAVYELVPSTHGNPEGVAYDRAGKAFFVGATGDGTIYRGTLGSSTVTEFIPGAVGRSSVGMKVDGDRLVVAGGGTGRVDVYDIRHPRLLGSISAPGAGFLNDLVITRNGDAWVTDSFTSTLWHITARQLAAAKGTATAVDLSATIPSEPGAFNLNGIVDLGRGVLLVVQSNTGALWRIRLGGGGVVAVRQVRVAPLVAGDGMIVDRGRLVVVQGAAQQLTFVKLRRGGTRGEIDSTLTDPSFDGPSTVARAKNRYLVVNADFATSTPPFTVSGVARERGA